jgi:hypothetical protein
MILHPETVSDRAHVVRAADRVWFGTSSRVELEISTCPPCPAEQIRAARCTSRNRVNNRVELSISLNRNVMVPRGSSAVYAQLRPITAACRGLPGFGARWLLSAPPTRRSPAGPHP